MKANASAIYSSMASYAEDLILNYLLREQYFIFMVREEEGKAQKLRLEKALHDYYL